MNTVPGRAAHHVALLLTAVLAATAALVAGGARPASAAATTDCPAVEVIMLAGTGETNSAADPNVPVGMLKPVADQILGHFDGGLVTVTSPAYSASAFNKGKSYGASKQTGIAAAAQAMQERAQACPNTKFGLMGYSQGADAAGDLNWLIGHDRGPVPAEKIVGVGLVADPRQSSDGGATHVGPAVDGVGIAGPRPGGFGKTADVTWSYCAPNDLYCATNAEENGLLAGLGRVLSQPAAPDSGKKSSPSGSKSSSTTTAELQDALVSDYSKVNLAGVPDMVDQLQTELQSESPNLEAIGTAATNLKNTIVPVAETSSWVEQNEPVAASLRASDPSSPEHYAGQVVDSFSGMDIEGAIRNVESIAQTVQSAHGDGGDWAAQMQPAVDSLADEMTPLTTTPADGLALAADALAVLKPSTLVNQTTHIATQTLSFAGNLPEVFDIVTNRIPRTILDPLLDPAAKIQAVHAHCDRLNVLFEPLVRLAAGLDYDTAAALIGMIPDPSGISQVVSMVVRMIGDLDIIGLANSIGEMQKLFWHALETGDVIGAGLGALPHLAELAHLAVGALSGGGTKTDPAQLGAPTQGGSLAQQITAQSQSGDLRGIANSLTSLASSGASDDLGFLVSEGLTAAAFFGPSLVGDGAHQSYAQLVVDESGTTALHDLAGKFIDVIGASAQRH